MKESEVWYCSKNRCARRARETCSSESKDRNCKHVKKQCTRARLQSTLSTCTQAGVQQLRSGPDLCKYTECT